MKGQKVDDILKKYAQVVISRMENLKTNYKQPWFNVAVPVIPQNLSGRKYNSLNAVLLTFLCLEKEYKTPVFLTFNQAADKDVLIKRGEKSFPVYYSCPTAIDKLTNEKIDIITYNNLTNEEKNDYQLFFFPKYYNVFNLDQTDMQDKHPEKYKKILDSFNCKDISESVSNGYSNEIIDTMLEKQSWVCPIKIGGSDSAIFNFKTDEIKMPHKEQFFKGEDFYTTLLHEMTHSTGMPERLDRDGFNQKEKVKLHTYGKEELIAEFTAALLSIKLGYNSSIQDDNIAYIKGWIKNIKENPLFLMNVLTEINKAEKFISNHLGINANLTLEQEEDFTKKTTPKKKVKKTNALKKISKNFKTKQTNTIKSKTNQNEY